MNAGTSIGSGNWAVRRSASAGRDAGGKQVPEQPPAPARLRSNMLDNLAQGNGLKASGGLSLTEDALASHQAAA